MCCFICRLHILYRYLPNLAEELQIITLCFLNYGTDYFITSNLILGKIVDYVVFDVSDQIEGSGSSLDD